MSGRGFRKRFRPPRSFSRCFLSTAGQHGNELHATIAGARPTNSRWLTELESRLHMMTSAGMSVEKTEEAKNLLQHVNTRWLHFLAGRQGFLAEGAWSSLTRAKVAWGDMDSMVSEYIPQHQSHTANNDYQGHVNNVMYNRYVESARVNWIRHLGQHGSLEQKQKWDQLVTPRRVGLILKTIQTDFKFPMKFPDHFTVLYKLREPPNYDSTSLKLEALVISDEHRRVAARCVEEVAIYDYRVSKKTALEPFMVERMRETHGIQESFKSQCNMEAETIIQSILKLEGEV